MKNIVIAGTSGVGKTFLEQELERLNLSFQLPKYTNRLPRPEENSNKNVCISTFEFQNFHSSDSFFYTLDYCGFKYGWKRQDLLLHQNISVTLAIPLEELVDFLSKNPTFLPILLIINPSDLSLIKRRLYDREKFYFLSPEKQIEVKTKIDQRLTLAQKEIGHIPHYKKLVMSHNSLIFFIKDDRTVFSEVIPALKKLLENSLSD